MKIFEILQWVFIITIIMVIIYGPVITSNIFSQFSRAIVSSIAIDLDFFAKTFNALVQPGQIPYNFLGIALILVVLWLLFKR